MPCRTPEAFSLLHALMAEGGWDLWEVCSEGRGSRRLPQPVRSTGRVSRVLAKDNVAPLPAQDRRGLITRPPGLLWQKSRVVRREGGSALVRSAQPQEPPSRMALRPACFVSQPPCSQPSSFVLPAHLRHRIASALHRAGCQLALSRSGWERAGHLPPLPRILTMDTPAPLQCCIFKSPPSHDTLPVHQAVLDPMAGRGPKGLGGKSPGGTTPQPPSPVALAPSPRQKGPRL